MWEHWISKALFHDNVWLINVKNSSRMLNVSMNTWKQRTVWWIKHKIISTDNIVILTRSENDFRLNFKCLKRIDLNVLYNYIQKRPERIENSISCFYASWTPLTALLFHISCCTFRFFCVRLTIDIGHYSLALDACQLDPCPDPYSIVSHQNRRQT